MEKYNTKVVNIQEYKQKKNNMKIERNELLKLLKEVVKTK